MRTAIFSNKGGVGKSSLATNLAGANALRFKEPTLIIDFDGQANTTSSFLDPTDITEGTSQLMLGKKKLHEVVRKVSDNLYIVPADLELNELEFDVLVEADKYSDNLLTLMSGIDTSEFAECFYDLPPSLGLISTNVMAVSDRVCIPYVPEPFSVWGLMGVIRMINEVKKNTNPDLTLAGVIANRYDSRLNVHKQLLKDCKDFCDKEGYNLFKTIIRSHSMFPYALYKHSVPAVYAAEKDRNFNTPQVKAIYTLLDEIKEC
ncbi:MAG: ParA family protein [Bacillota bacterium]